MKNNGKIEWKSDKRSLSELKPSQYNPRQITEAQAKDLEKSLERFNVADPIVINSDNTIIGGHMRYQILKQKGVQSIDCRIPSRKLTQKEEQELNIRLNKNLGEWDYDKLANFDEEMLLDIGFDSKELDRIFQLEPDAKDDEIPENVEPKCKVGEIYHLGRHRLMCGDSTQVGDVERLMGGFKGDLIVTDPPYGVNYQKKDSANREIKGDESLEIAKKIWSGAFKNYHKFAKDGASYYSFSCQGGDQMMMMMMMIGENWLVKHELMWLKNNFVFGRCDYKYKHEPIIYGWKKGMTHQFYGDAKQSSVFQYDRPRCSDGHPTMKPVDLLAHLIRNSSKLDDIIMDLFLGSGSTLIACEKTNRICYGMELDPKYCDVIIKRYEEYTGNKAEKVTRQTDKVHA